MITCKTLLQQYFNVETMQRNSRTLGLFMPRQSFQLNASSRIIMAEPQCFFSLDFLEQWSRQRLLVFCPVTLSCFKTLYGWRNNLRMTKKHTKNKTRYYFFLPFLLRVCISVWVVQRLRHIFWDCPGKTNKQTNIPAPPLLRAGLHYVRGQVFTPAKRNKIFIFAYFK